MKNTFKLLLVLSVLIAGQHLTAMEDDFFKGQICPETYCDVKKDAIIESLEKHSKIFDDKKRKNDKIGESY